MNNSSSLTLGIDFGTCRSSAAVFIDDQLHSVPFGTSEKPDFPTAVFVERREHILVGDEAVQGALRNPDAFFKEFKLKIGRGENLYIGDETFEYKDLVAAVLQRIRLTAQTRLNNENPITSACITVPALYVEGGDPWKIMEQAAYQAGFEKVRIIREPHAAAIYYDWLLRQGTDISSPQSQITLVYDLGGGTFDPAIIRRRGNDYKILDAVAGEDGVRCGGIYFDEKIREDFAAKCTGVIEQLRFDPSKESGVAERVKRWRDILKLQEFLHDAKIRISEPGVEEFLGEEPVEGKEYRLTRKEFEGLISPLLDQTTACCDALIRHSNVEWKQIDRILMVGGSCNIPLVRKKLEKLSRDNGASPEICWRRIGTTNRFYNPLLAVCFGAGILGGENLVKEKPSKTPDNHVKNFKKPVAEQIKIHAKETIEVKKNPSAPEGFVWIPGGSFMMGSNYSHDEKPAHLVTVSGFYMSKTPVTQAEFEKVMRKNPSDFRNPGNPVENVTWQEAKKYCEKVGARLPTEAEWEYACRAGSTTRYYWGDEFDGNFAWCDENSGNETHPVAQKKPNAFGLYDMTGNVWEWCEDRYDENYYKCSPSVNPKGPSTGEYRVIRGGSWSSYDELLRSARRRKYSPDSRDNGRGFRCVKDEG